MDGVLYDSMPRHERTWCQVFAEEGLPFAPEEAYLNEGRTGSDTISQVWLRARGVEPAEEDVRRLYQRKLSLFSDLARRLGPAPVLPGMRELLSDLPRLGAKPFIVTGSRQPTLVDALRQTFGVERHHIVTAADVTHGKPHPEPYLRALLLSRQAPQSCLVVENAPLGVRSGRDAGLTVWAVNTGKLSDTVLSDAGANRLFHSTQELANEVRNAFSA